MTYLNIVLCSYLLSQLAHILHKRYTCASSKIPLAININWVNVELLQILLHSNITFCFPYSLPDPFSNEPSPDQLQETRMQLVDNRLCAEELPEIFRGSAMLCAGYAHGYVTGCQVIAIIELQFKSRCYYR